MNHRHRARQRTLIILGTLAAAVVMAAAATASGGAQLQPRARSSAAHLIVGVADRDTAMFTDTWFRRLPVRVARASVSWNAAVERNRAELNGIRDWINAAVAAHVSPLISFAGNGNYIPSAKTYAAAVKAFVHDFPQVRSYTPWNEPDWIYRPSLSDHPDLAAAYFNALVGACRSCTIVAGDVYRPASDGLTGWLRAYRRALHYTPVAWAIHPYDDVRSHTTSQMRALESVAGRSQIWLTEISGVERRGHWPYPDQSPNGADRDERFLFTLPEKFTNLSRIYHYQWQADRHQPWDSALLGPQGKPRPAYWTFADATHGKLR